jgi:membrane protease YdiL (CAAX protease family)
VEEHSRQERIRPDPRDRSDGRLLAGLELLLVIVILAAFLRGFIPISETPVLLLLAWVSLRRRGLGWSAIGLTRPRNITRAIVLGVVAGVGYAFLSMYLLDPLIDRLAAQPADLSEFAAVRGNVPMLVFWLVLSWTLAAVGEEVTYRGYVMNRAADLFGGTAAAWAAAVLVTSVLFGVGHLYQGASGVASNFASALVYSGLYLLSGRNLWVPILAHGMENTVGFILIFLGRYPGL